jgi:hypothetical protein
MAAKKNMVEYCDAHRKELEQQSASQALKRPKYKEHEAYADFKQRIWVINWIWNGIILLAAISPCC